MNRTKIIEDQIRCQGLLIGNLRYEIKQCKLPERATQLQAQLAHALAGLAALCRDGESTKGVAVEVTEEPAEETAEYGVARAVDSPVERNRWRVHRNGKPLAAVYETKAEAEYAMERQLEYQRAMARYQQAISETTKPSPSDLTEALATLSACFDHLADVDWQPIRDAVRGVEENIRNIEWDKP
jgi:cation transport regulator ChaC